MTYISIWNQYFRYVLEVAWDIVTQFGTIQIVTQVETQIVTQVQRTRTITSSIITQLAKANGTKSISTRLELRRLNNSNQVQGVYIHYHYIQFPLSL